MAKAIEVLKQLKFQRKGRGVNYLDVVKREDGWYEVRVYRTTSSKIGGGLNYGIHHTVHYTGEERIQDGYSEGFRDLPDAEAYFKDKLEYFTNSPFGYKKTTPRKLKLIDWNTGRI